MPAGIWLAASTLVVGWIALLPLRERMGIGGYHLSAIPVGVLGWTFVSAVSMALSSGWHPLIVSAALTVWCLLVWLAASRLVGVKLPIEVTTRALHWPTYAMVLAVVVLFSVIFAGLGISAFSADGWSQYEPDGIILHETGTTTPRALGNRMVAVSALHAAYHLFGGEFTHVIQPVMGLVTALLVAAGIWWATGGRMSTGARLAVTAVPTLGMLTNPVYAFHSIYIHSHMISAMFLALAVVAFLRSYSGSAMDPGWLLVAGLATAGLLLSRPDGAAYSMVPILVATVLLLRTKASTRASDAYFAPLLATSMLVIAGGFIQHGFWWTRKLSLSMLLFFLAAYALVWVGVRFLSRRQLFARLTNDTAVLWLVVLANLVGLFTVWQLWTETVTRSIANMSSNLLATGGYRGFWPLMTGAVVGSLLLRPRKKRYAFTAYALFAVVQFMIVAFVVHGTMHPGRIGWGDSFTRVSFQVVPLIYLYLGLYLSELVETLTTGTE